MVPLLMDALREHVTPIERFFVLTIAALLRKASRSSLVICAVATAAIAAIRTVAILRIAIFFLLFGYRTQHLYARVMPSCRVCLQDLQPAENKETFLR